EHRPVQQAQAPGIDKDLRAVRTLNDEVRRPGRLLPAERVFESRTAAGLDTQPEARFAKAAPGEHLPDVSRGAFCHLNHDVRLSCLPAFKRHPGPRASKNAA